MLKNHQNRKLHDELDVLLIESQKAKQNQRAGLKRIQETIANNVQAQVALSTLAKMLEEKQYVQIRDAVRTGATGRQRPKKQYTPAALFLILESMGGTWCMYEKLVKDKKPDAAPIAFDPNYAKQSREYEQNLRVILRQTLYDLTMWDSILNSPKKTRYMSHNVQKFIDAYGLDNNEPTDSLQESSDDDAPDAPPPAAAWPEAPNSPVANAPSTPDTTLKPSPPAGTAPLTQLNNGRSKTRVTPSLPAQASQSAEDEF
jgi:hypothetical protein